MLNQISYVVFEKDVGEDLQNTVLTISTACKNLPSLQYEIIIVDDGSTKKPNVETLKELDQNIRNIIFLDKTLGISGAILSALPHCNFQNVLPVPGHNMFSVVAVQNVSKLVGQARIIIGCRNNLAKERPPIKKLASRILRDLYRHLTFYFISDIHGLNIYRKEDLEKYLSVDGGHTNAIAVVTPVLASGGSLIQTLAPINQGHDKRASRTRKDSIPRPKNVIKIIKILIEARKIYLQRLTSP